MKLSASYHIFASGAMLAKGGRGLYNMYMIIFKEDFLWNILK